MSIKSGSNVLSTHVGTQEAGRCSSTEFSAFHAQVPAPGESMVARIRDALEADLHKPETEHQQLVHAIKAVADNLPTESEIRLLQPLVDGLVTDPPLKVFKDQPVRLQAILITLTRQCDAGSPNALTSHWSQLSTDQQVQLRKLVLDYLVVLRARAGVVHGMSPKQLEVKIDLLMKKLHRLPERIRLPLTEAILSGRLNCSPGILIHKLSMLQLEMPEARADELQKTLTS